jgi:hypothetical protein
MRIVEVADFSGTPGDVAVRANRAQAANRAEQFPPKPPPAEPDLLASSWGVLHALEFLDPC